MMVLRTSRLEERRVELERPTRGRVPTAVEASSRRSRSNCIHNRTSSCESRERSARMSGSVTHERSVAALVAVQRTGAAELVPLGSVLVRH